MPGEMKVPMWYQPHLALAQADAKPTVLAIHTRENASTDQVYVEMNNIHEP